MTDSQRTVDAAVAAINSLQKLLKRRTSKQINSDDEKQIAKATALTWFNNHRPVVAAPLGDDQLKPIDDLYRALIAATTKASVRTKYLSTVKNIKKVFGAIQTEHVLALAAPPAAAPSVTSDTVPKFDPLISDSKMQTILTKRWKECSVCVNSGAPLAATVMMGGLLEGLLLAKINQIPNKTSVFTAATTPKDPKTGKALQLKEWTLKNYIDVAHEVGWITKTTKDIGEVVRDYRNLSIHKKSCRTALFSNPAMRRCSGKLPRVSPSSSSNLEVRQAQGRQINEKPSSNLRRLTFWGGLGLLPPLADDFFTGYGFRCTALGTGFAF